MDVIQNQLIPNEENSHKIKSKKIVKTVSTGERHSLKTLQLAQDGTLIGIESRQGKGMRAKPVSVYTDPVRTWKEFGTQTDRVGDRVEGSTQTDEVEGLAPIVQGLDDSGAVVDIDAEAYDLMVKEPAPEAYWQVLAEQRRQALAETLVENESLHTSMGEMKEENEKLSELAEHAECLVNIITTSPGLNTALNEALGDDDLAQELLRAVSSPNLGTVSASSRQETGPAASTPTRGNTPSRSKPEPLWPIFSPSQPITTSSPCEETSKQSDGDLATTEVNTEKQPDEETKKGSVKETNTDSDELEQTDKDCGLSEGDKE